MNFFKTATEHRDGTFSIEGSKARYTLEEFRKLKSLMPETGWVLFAVVRPEQITNPAFVRWEPDDENINLKSNEQIP